MTMDAITLPLIIIIVFSIFELVLIAVLMNKIDWLVHAEKVRQCSH